MASTAKRSPLIPQHIPVCEIAPLMFVAPNGEKSRQVTNSMMIDPSRPCLSAE